MGIRKRHFAGRNETTKIERGVKGKNVVWSIWQNVNNVYEQNVKRKEIRHFLEQIL